MLCSRIHFLLVEPFVMRHRRIVCISTNRKQKKNAECRQYAMERLHGSLREGLSLVSAFANHTNCLVIDQATFKRKWNPISEKPSALGKTVVSGRRLMPYKMHCLSVVSV